MRFDRLMKKTKRRGGGWEEDLERDHAFQRAILAIPAGKVSTYGKVAEDAGYPRYHRAVARFLGGEHSGGLPWHRVVGAGGAIKTSGTSAKRQRSRLRQEGVPFRGERVDIGECLFQPRKGGGFVTEE